MKTRPILAVLASSVCYVALAVPVAAQDQAPKTAAFQPQPEPAAQDSPAQTEQPGDIVVTGSRVATGAASATPLTSLGEADLLRAAPTSIANIINTLPAARSSVTPKSTANESSGSGGNFLDLRGLGYTRTLTLVDGRRFVPSNVRGGVDLDLIPQTLINGVDVVTGGVSAVYGSDAVSGVVNLRLDDKFEGFKAVAQGGVSDYGDERQYLLSAAFGKAFAGGRGHFVVAAEAMKNEGVSLRELYDRDWASKNWGLIANPAATPTNSEPNQLLVQNANPSNRAVGGLINTTVLRGTQFGPGGTPFPFQYGTLVTSTTMQGGTSDQIFYTQPEAPSRRRTIFAKASYDISDAISVFGEFSYGQNLQAFTRFTNDTYASTETATTIRNDNAFLPASIRTAMSTAGITSFVMGRQNLDYLQVHTRLDRKVYRGAAGIEGKLGENWRWDAYYTHGETDAIFEADHLKNTAKYALAVDAVINPATGQAVCRSTLTNPADGCVPINLFGPGSVSQAAANYVSGRGFFKSDLSQDVAAFSLRGDAFSTWAGPVRVALGGEYRHETANVAVDAVSAVGGWSPWGNLRPWSGKVTVKEGFAETQVPLARDASWAKTLDLNIAGRVTDYSTSGSVVTWKIGLTYEPIKGIKFRGTRSRDIRAPTLFDLFSTGATSGTPIIDPATGNSVQPLVTTTGNRNLRPEKADTWTAGMVLQPHFAPGLTLSLDYYNIRVNDAINNPVATEILQDCFKGNAALCALIGRVNGVPTTIAVSPVNLEWVKTSGIDLELTYRTGTIESGQLLFRGFVSYTDDLTTSFLGIRKHYAGSVVQPTTLGIGGQPHWKTNASVTYARGPFSGTLTGRYVGGGVVDPTFTTKNLADLDVKGRFYADLAASYDLTRGDSGRTQIFATVSNVFNRSPPIVITAGYQTVRALYDSIGRTYSAGVRFKF